MRLDFTQPVKREIALFSNNHCMICDKDTVKPRIAHIIPASEKGPRSEWRNSYDASYIGSSSNGLCLCNDCHDKIDDDGLNCYSLEELQEINMKYQKSFNLLTEYKKTLGLMDVNYAIEIKKFYNVLIQKLNVEDEEIVSLLPQNTFNKVEIEEKMKLNNLSNFQRRRILNSYAYEFHIFQEALEYDSIVAIKFLSAVKILYKRLSNEFDNQSEILDEMKKIMVDPSEGVVENDIVLSYFFIICEVFLT
ncbi:HNH endonuclease signature motif containing protein [Paenilisteria newyorkensis]|uniref:HNH endonuclease signature motif containing protein n=1 Tax=Listeria newyorkensis TaxID=1497681 RepID=UPI000669E92C|nr:HNH endonuclease signature motif containing protein [Listeria newyorkensis]KMT61248.1 hypothetical protein X559_2214 [Listeria newyorkensis]